MKKILNRLVAIVFLISTAYMANAQTESAEETAGIQKFLATKYAKEAPESRKFMYAAIDLNDDGKHEYIVAMVGPAYCGSGGCTMLVLTNSYKQNSIFTVVDFPIYVGAPASKEVTKKYSNIYVYSKGKGYVKLAWNGTKYGPSNASMAPKVSDDIKNGKTAFLEMPATKTYTF